MYYCCSPGTFAEIADRHVVALAAEGREIDREAAVDDLRLTPASVMSRVSESSILVRPLGEHGDDGFCIERVSRDLVGERVSHAQASVNLLSFFASSRSTLLT